MAVPLVENWQSASEMSEAAVRVASWEQPSPQTSKPQQLFPVVAASVRPIPILLKRQIAAE
ncbi:hypothetical protein HJB61_02880 [Rhizobium lentis]|nr:hypothetical protein [Rhizobium lentis]